MIDKTDQWKLDGHCSKCRRELYCNKKCSALKKRQMQMITKGTHQTLLEPVMPILEGKRYD